MAVLWLSLLCLPACAQDADTILRKCFAHYDSARTLQGTFLVTGQTSLPDDTYDKVDFNLTNDKQGHVERYAERRWAKHSEAIRDDDWYQRAAEEAPTAPPTAYTVERDKTGFLYYPDTKEYKSCSFKPGKCSQRLLERFGEFAPLNLAADEKPVVSEITDEGKPAYKIQVKRRNQMVNEVIIDKRTYQLKKLIGYCSVAMISVVFSNQRLNAPMPEALFSWSPPKDYKVRPAAPTPGGPDP